MHQSCASFAVQGNDKTSTDKCEGVQGWGLDDDGSIGKLRCACMLPYHTACVLDVCLKLRYQPRFCTQHCVDSLLEPLCPRYATGRTIRGLLSSLLRSWYFPYIQSSPSA
jgi:hypothetical protein